MPTGDGLESLADLVDYFDATYVSGSASRVVRPASSHRIQPLRVRRTLPLFPLAIWNAQEITMAGTDCTNNICEPWNNGFANLVGHQHPSLWTLIETLQQDEAMATTAVIQDSRGQPPVKRVKRSTQQLQLRLQTLCADRRDNKMSIADSLRGLGNIIRF
jgi:hypothetical protein